MVKHWDFERDTLFFPNNVLFLKQRTIVYESLVSWEPEQMIPQDDLSPRDSIVSDRGLLSINRTLTSISRRRSISLLRLQVLHISSKKCTSDFASISHDTFGTLRLPRGQC